MKAAREGNLGALPEACGMDEGREDRTRKPRSKEDAVRGAMCGVERPGTRNRGGKWENSIVPKPTAYGRPNPAADLTRCAFQSPPPLPVLHLPAVGDLSTKPRTLTWPSCWLSRRRSPHPSPALRGGRNGGESRAPYGRQSGLLCDAAESQTETMEGPLVLNRLYWRHGHGRWLPSRPWLLRPPAAGLRSCDRDGPAHKEDTLFTSWLLTENIS
ncbi:uncharacterized protein LOC125135750 [Phacochoerus africanus]|uniref:uncharacterized protein LOC125135750 n=1 Tax=Phacochoerus africanus TaxID=41426 RepID=UPI001FD9171A|nr:uncharacterized protein LOC125135750 [Phacochoerus africanus]